MSLKPTLVFVHGGWHGPESLHKVREPLEALGYTCHAPQMPSVEFSKSKTLLDDCALVHGTVEQCADAGEDVIIVGHSSGGFISCEAARGLTKQDRQAQGKAGGVIAIGMISAFIPPVNGKGAFAKVPPPDPSWWVFDDEGITFRPDGPPGPHTLFYNDMPKEEADYWVSKLRPMNVPKHAPNYYEAWRDLPLYYLICENDQGQPLAMQEAMIEAAREEGGDIITERIFAGHSPFLSMPMEVVRWIRRVAGEDKADL